MSDLFLSAPWWLWTTLAAVGVVLVVSANAKQQAGPRNAGLGLIGLAILLLAISLVYETDKKKCSRLSKEMVKSVEDRDWTTFTNLTDADCSLVFALGTIDSNRAALVESAKNNCDRYGLKNVSAHVTEVTQDASGVTVDLDASSEQSSTMGYRVPSSWRFLWDKTGGDWHLHQITCLKLGNETGDEISKFIGK